MKRVIFTILSILIFAIHLSGYEAEDIYLTDWKTYTNTTHIHQFMCKGDSIISATWGGISIFDTSNETFSTLVKSDGLGKHDVRSVHYIPDVNEYWFGTSTEGVSRYQDGGFLRPYQENQGVDCSYINAIGSVSDFVFLGTDEGLTMFEMLVERIQFIKTFDAPRWLYSDYVNAITFDDSNRIWVATNEGIDYAVINYDSMLVVDGWWKHVNENTPDYPFEDSPISTIDYYNGKIYFGSQEGLGIVDDIYSETPTFSKYTNFLPSQHISSIKVENDSMVWVGSGTWDETNQTYKFANGVARYNIHNPLESQTWNEDDGLCDMISDIDIDDSGVIWVSSWGEDLYRYKNETWYHHKRNCINSNVIGEMMIDIDNDLWCGFSRINLSPASKKGASKLHGNEWINYDTSNSGIGNNTVYSMCQDYMGNMWFGHWGGTQNISVLEPSTNTWTIYKNVDEEWIMSPAISFINCDEDHNIWVASYAGGPGGVSVLKPDDTFESFFPDQIYEDENAADMITMKIIDGKVWFGSYYSGIQYWDGPGFPKNGEIYEKYWEVFGGASGLSCYNYDIQYDGEYIEYLFASCGNGLYMYDYYWDTWFKYTSGQTEDVKIYRHNGISWVNYDYYWYDDDGIPESRMGAGKASQVSEVFVDPHNRKWIATNGGGISMLDEENYTFQNFTTENSSLPSDIVLSLAYDIYTGELYAGTSEGLCSFNIGAGINNGEGTGDIDGVVIYPNPFKPAEMSCIYFESKPHTKLPIGDNMLYIYNLAGELVAEIPESDHFRFFWDGTNNGKAVASGVYFYVLASESEKTYLNGKFAIIR